MIEFGAVDVLDALDAVSCRPIAEFTSRCAVFVGVTAGDALVGHTGVGFLAVAIGNAVYAVRQVTVADFPLAAVERVDTTGDRLTRPLVADAVWPAFGPPNALRAFAEDGIAEECINHCTIG